MGLAKDFAKGLIKTLPPQMQHRLRRYYLARDVLAGREFHEIEMNALATIVAAGDAVADIGANVGAYTRHLSSLVGPAGRVCAFEPVSANYDILQTVVTKGSLANVQLFKLALAAAIEEREITIPELGGFTGYYWAHFAKAGEHGEKVSVTTLDELVRKSALPRLDFIKCDVEGSEIEVLRGGRGLVDAQRPAWLIEVSRDTSGDVFATLRSAGYRAFVYDGKLHETMSYRDKEFSNYFFFHPGSKVWPRLGIT